MNRSVPPEAPSRVRSVPVATARHAGGRAGPPGPPRAPAAHRRLEAHRSSASRGCPHHRRLPLPRLLHPLRRADPIGENRPAPPLPAGAAGPPGRPQPRLPPRPLVLPSVGAARGPAHRPVDPPGLGPLHRHLLLPAAGGRGRLHRSATLGDRHRVLPHHRLLLGRPLLAPGGRRVGLQRLSPQRGGPSADDHRRRRQRGRSPAAGPAALRRAQLRGDRFRRRPAVQTRDHDRGTAGPRVPRRAPGDLPPVARGADPLRHPPPSSGPPAPDPRRLRRAEAELQDGAGVLRLPAGPAERQQPAEPGSRGPAESPGGALRRPTTSGPSSRAGASSSPGPPAPSAARSHDRCRCARRPASSSRTSTRTGSTCSTAGCTGRTRSWTSSRRWWTSATRRG